MIQNQVMWRSRLPARWLLWQNATWFTFRLRGWLNIILDQTHFQVRAFGLLSELRCVIEGLWLKSESWTIIWYHVCKTRQIQEVVASQPEGVRVSESCHHPPPSKLNPICFLFCHCLQLYQAQHFPLYHFKNFDSFVTNNTMNCCYRDHLVMNVKEKY